MATVNHASTRGQRRGTIRTRPHERILASYPNCHVRVLFLPTQRALESRGGTCTVSSQRLVFTSNQASEELDTLSVPLETMSVGKYMLPIFCAPYWQATMTHFTDGTSDHGQVIVRFPAAGACLFNRPFEQHRRNGMSSGIMKTFCVRINDLTLARYDEQGITLDTSSSPPAYQ